MTTTIYTLGYSGWKIEQIESELARLNAVLVDVRMVPRTRWAPLFNSASLAARLGVRYVWLRQFGNVNYRGTFEQILIADFDAGRSALEALLASLIPGTSVILLCGCRDVNVCHRKVVAERLAALWKAEVVHLERPQPQPLTPGLF